MAVQFEEWLRQLAAAKKGPVSIEDVTRGRAWSTTVTLDGDWTGATLSGQVRLYPDAAGDPLATFSVAGPAVADGTSTFTVSLASGSGINSTGALPADAETEGVCEFAYDLLLTPGGGTQELLFGGAFKVIGRVTA